MSIGSVILDGLELNGYTRYGEGIVTALSGWHGRPAPQGESADRPNEDGEFDLPVYSAARNITITGTVLPKSAADLETWTDRANGLIGSSKSRLQVTGYAGTRWCDVRWDGASDVDELGHQFSRYGTFQFKLKAVNPRKYAEANVFDGGAGSAGTAAVPGTNASVFHRGNYPARPFVKITGSMPGGYALNIGGALYRVTVPLVTGTAHTIDYMDGYLRVGGVIVAAGSSNTTMAQIQPGAVVSVSIAPITSGTGRAEITVLDTFI